MPNILDFNDKGGAIIEIPQFLNPNKKGTIMIEVPKFEPSLIFFKNPSLQLLEIEKDIPFTDTRKRQNFLVKYKDVLSKYVSKNADFGKSYWNRYKKKNTISVYYEPFGIRISISYYQLRHSLAWYMQSGLESAINQEKQSLEVLYGFLRICDEDLLDRVIAIIRNAVSPLEARYNLIKDCGFSEIQALSIVTMRLRNLTSLLAESLKEDIKPCEEMKSFLEELKD